jgi:2,4-dienoyl-CoA reductase-like NADH-dependent reductase (Old Yellow Enzyme family)
MQFDYLGGSVSAYIRSVYTGTLVGVGSYTAEAGSAAIDANKFDLLAIGRPFIANPDYVAKVRNGDELVPYAETMLAELI